MLKKITAIILSSILLISSVAGAWYDEPYEKLKNDGIIVTNQSFEPDKYISLIEFVTLICRAEKIYPDTTTIWWTQAYASDALSNKIIRELPENRWAGTISRYQAAEIIYNNNLDTMENKNIDVLGETILDFPTMPEEYRNIVGQLYLNGIISGRTDGKFSGWDAITRGEAVTLIYRAYYPEYRLTPVINEFSQVLGEFTTYTTNVANRNFNVNKAAEALNGTIIQPGKQFSYNSIVGNAGKAEGYKQATVISGGKYVKGYGGGICQDATTLFNAALLANMQIDERYNHALKSSYVKPGYDATVAYGTLDFKFTNPYDVPIKITASFDYNTLALTFKIYSASYIEKPEVKLYTKGSGNKWTLYREVNGIQNYSTYSSYRG